MSDKPRFGRYELVSELGRGGMGIVYRGLDTMLDRQVAVKALPPNRLNKDMVERFYREARAVARLHSPHIVAIYDIGEHNDGQNVYYYIVMEFVDGGTLGEHFPEGPSDKAELRRRVQLFDQVLEGVEYAHSKSVVHRDLKPDNLMVTPTGRVKIMDFGLAFVADSHSLTRADQIMGTVAYFSPEQAKASQGIDHRADIYSLGVILFELMTGSLPFEAQHPVDMMRKVLEEKPRKPSSLNPDVDPALEKICLRCLEKEPALRFRQVSELRKALKDALDPPKLAKPIPPRPPVEEPSPRPPRSVPPVEKRAPATFQTTPDAAPAAPKKKEPEDAVSALATAFDLPVPARDAEDDSQLRESKVPGTSMPQIKSLHPAMASTNWQLEVHSQRDDEEPEEELSPLPEPAPPKRSGPSIFCQCGGENPPEADICLECGETIKPSIYIVRREAETHFSAGMQAVARGHFREARDEFRRAVEQNREFGEAYYELGRVELSLGEFEQAHDHLELALQYLPSRFQPLLALADLYQQVEQPEDVVACLREILEDRPRDTDIRCRLALLYCQLGEMEKALATYRTALKHDPENLGANRQLGLLLASEGRVDEAIYYLEVVCRLDPRDAHVRGIIGKLYAKAGQLRRAEEAFVQALELRRDDPDLRVELGELYARQGRADKASSQLRKTLRAEDGHLGASRLLAGLYMEQGQLGPARELLETAIRFHPEDDALHRQLGEVHLLSGALDHALECFEKVVELRPDCAEMRNTLGRVYLKKNYDDRSIEEYQNAVRLDRLNPAYREDLGMAYYVSGKLEEAAGELHKATKIDAKNADYFRALGFIYQELNIPKQSVDHFKWALHLEPDHARTRGALAQALMSQGLANQAVDQFRMALQQDPSLVLLHLSLARALASVGRHQEAVDAFRKFASSIDSEEHNQLMSRAFLEMGHACLESGDIGQAAEIFQAALSQPDEEASARLGLAKVSLARSDLRAASNHCKRALETEPLNSEVWHTWSLVAAEQGDWNEAISRIDRAVNLSPNREDLWIQLGRCYRKAGRPREADDVFAKGAVQFPQSAARFFWLRGRLAVRMKDWTNAYQHLDQSLAVAPGSWRVHEDMGLTCIGLQNWDLARRHINKAADLAPVDKRDSVLSLLGRIPS